MFLNAFILLQEYFSGLVILIAIDLLLLESIHITEDGVGAGRELVLPLANV
jgi:hypothetical protein